MTTEDLRELIERLELTDKRLRKLANKQAARGGGDYNYIRLRGKAEGVRLAKSYAEEILREEGKG